MWKLILALLLFAAHLNLTALVPLQPGDPPPPWWVGGRLIWPFAIETPTLLQGAALNTLTPVLAIASAISILLAAAALLRKLVPGKWFQVLIIFGAISSIILQIVWFSVWAILPLLVDALLLLAVFRQRITVENLRG